MVLSSRVQHSGIQRTGTSERIGFWPNAHDVIGPELADKLIKVQSYTYSAYFEEKYKDRQDLLRDFLEAAPQFVDTDTKDSGRRETRNR